MGAARLFPFKRHPEQRTAAPFVVLCLFTLLMLAASTAVGDVVTLDTVDQGIAAYDRGDYPRAFEVFDDLADDHPAQPRGRVQ